MTEARWKTVSMLISSGARRVDVHTRTVQGFVIQVIEKPGGWAFEMHRDRFEFKARGLSTIGRAKTLAYDTARKLAFLPDMLRGS